MPGMRYRTAEQTTPFPLRNGMQTPAKILEMITGDGAGRPENLPFSLGDTTAGSETELQAAVAGKREDVDLALALEQSRYFANAAKRAAAGDTSPRLIRDLERYLGENDRNIWESSWVRFPKRMLNRFAADVLEHDLLADKKNPAAGRRGDAARFTLTQAGEEYLRVPVSYLIKLALADYAGRETNNTLSATAAHLMSHYLNDNTSPETFSFYVSRLRPDTSSGLALARETGKRFLLTQLMVMYANRVFGLAERGQETLIYFAPHPPVRQKQLNDIIPDSLYRELFMSPCLSGWDRGEEKFRYMHLCHQVLSRSQLNATAKLREAGIIINNLVVLPNLSNTSLANNGTHISLGSRRLTELLKDPSSGFTSLLEKCLGDLTIKMVEHFLPLFVGSFSAAPYRLDFASFHPELALGFLPHQLDYTHLRMLWRRWKKKARISVFGGPVTPFGPEWLDRTVSRLFRLRGDYLPDSRLIDYPVCLLSTDESPGLDGVPGNTDRLKNDLAQAGVFDSQMSVYLLYKLRECAVMGFSGFEGRHYSLFESLAEDMAEATDLQMLVTLLAFRYMAEGKLTHDMIPDDPSVESERRQIFFGAAIGIPTFFIKSDTQNLFLRKILELTCNTRSSSRYPGYARIYQHEYRRALLALLNRDARDLIELLGLQDTMQGIAARIDDPGLFSAEARLTRGILREGGWSSPFNASAREFNEAAENYYRGALRKRHLSEAFGFLKEGLAELRSEQDEEVRGILERLAPGDSAGFLAAAEREILDGGASLETLSRCIGLLLLDTRHNIGRSNADLNERRSFEHGTASIRRAG